MWQILRVVSTRDWPSLEQIINTVDFKSRELLMFALSKMQKVNLGRWC